MLPEARVGLNTQPYVRTTRLRLAPLRPIRSQPLRVGSAPCFYFGGVVVVDAGSHVAQAGLKLTI